MRHGQPGYYALADLPQRGSLAKHAFGTGWPEFDEIFKFYHGQFVVLTGFPGHGKSTFMLNVLAKMAKRKEGGISSFLYVPENEAYLLEKLLRIYNRPESFDYFAESQCFVQSAVPEPYNDSPQTIWWILDRARVAVEKDHVEVLMLDPWNEIERAIAKGQNLTDYIGECLMAIKNFSRVYNVSVVMVAHPTKAAAEKDELSLSDIEGSMNWWNKSDNALIISRKEKACVVTSAKVREIGAGKRGSCYFTVDPLTEVYTPMHGGSHGQDSVT
jgi:twinkle protein